LRDRRGQPGQRLVIAVGPVTRFVLLPEARSWRRQPPGIGASRRRRRHALVLADWAVRACCVLGRWTAVSVAPAEVERAETEEKAVPDSLWVTIVWNDPVNLMSYVTYVFQTVFGYAKPKAKKLMLDVHHKGKAVVSSGGREAMERDAETLHGYGLWATISHDS
jgi:ATP-dependent Clp protease adaptor protein ClpS